MQLEHGAKVERVVAAADFALMLIFTTATASSLHPFPIVRQHQPFSTCQAARATHFIDVVVFCCSTAPVSALVEMS